MRSGLSTVLSVVALLVFNLAILLVIRLAPTVLSRAIDRYQMKPSKLAGMLSMFGGLYLFTVSLFLPYLVAIPALVLSIGGTIAIAFGFEKIRIPPPKEFRPVWYRGEGNPEWSTERPRIRFPPQISLAWIGVLTLCLSVSFAVFGWRLHANRRAQQRNENAVARILQLGGTCQQGMVSLAGTDITDDDLIVLLDLTRIHDLNLGATAISNEGLRHVARLEQLRSLTLSGTEVNDEGLRRLAPLKRLLRLSLRQTYVTGTAFPINNSMQLISLDVSRCPITRDGLVSISKADCDSLSLGETFIDDSVLDLLKTMDLLTLNIMETGVSLAGRDKLQNNRPNMRLIWSSWVPSPTPNVDDVPVIGQPHSKYKD